MANSPAKSNRFQALLHGAGLKATPARLAVLEFLSRATKPVSMQHVEKGARGAGADQATIYRILRALQKQGLVREIDFRHGHAHYELAATAHHHHVVCENCGKIKSVSCDTSNLEKTVRKKSGFSQIRSHSLEFFGLCRDCSR